MAKVERTPEFFRFKSQVSCWLIKLAELNKRSKTNYLEFIIEENALAANIAKPNKKSSASGNCK